MSQSLARVPPKTSTHIDCGQLRHLARGLARAAVLAWSLALVASCTTITQQSPNSDRDSVSSTATDTPNPYAKVQVNFEARSLEVAPGTTLEVELNATPAGVYPVRVAIFGDDSGAYTNGSEFMTDAEGHARVLLTTPLDSKQLTLRASLGSHHSDLLITVQPDAIRSLLIVPQYTGKRPIRHWAVSVEPDVPCVGLNLYDAAYEAEQKRPPLTTEAAVNRTVTLLVRGEEYVSGCREGVVVEANDNKVVTIVVLDRLIQLSALDTQLTLGFERGTDFASELGEVVSRMLSAFRGGQSSDMDALLMHMARLSGAPEKFNATSTSEDWSGQLIENLTPRGAESGLSLNVEVWLHACIVRFLDTAKVHGRLTGNIPPPSHALFQVESVAGFAPRGVGIPDSFVLSVSAGAEDVLNLAFEFVWQPAKLLAAMAEEEALASTATDGGVGVPPSEQSPSGVGSLGAAVLADSILHCGSVGGLLSGPDGVAFEGCDQVCLAELCSNALVSMWEDLRNAEHSPASIRITSGHPAELDTKARPIGFNGGWVGKAVFGTAQPVDVSGQLSAGPAQY